MMGRLNGMCKRITALALAAAMFLAGVSVSVQAGAQKTGSRAQAAVRPEFPDMKLQEYPVDTMEAHSGVAIRSAASSSVSLSDSRWADDGNDYYFSKLTTKEKNLYLSLKQAADQYISGNANFQSTKVNRDGEQVKVYILPQTSYAGLTSAQMRRVVNCVLFENPQYYFLRNAIVYSEKSEMVSIGLYAAFANGSRRAAYTEKFEAQIEAWEAQYAQAGSQLQKEQAIHDLVCGAVTYNNNVELDDSDDAQMSQSCISAALFGRSTVCAGYAQLFTLLCGRADIQCVTVTSAGHAWNKVRLGGAWYNVDCTWDDYEGGFTRAYLNVTDAQIQKKDTAGEHIVSPEWNGLAPSCTEAFSEAAAGIRSVTANITAPEKMEGITALSAQKGKIAVSFKPQNGSDGYTVQYASDRAMKQSQKKNIASVKCEITGLRTGKAYYVRVRAYKLDAVGGKVYGAYSDVLKVTVK